MALLELKSDTLSALLPLLHYAPLEIPLFLTSGESMVVSQSLGLLITDSISFVTALSASQLHSSPTMFNPPSTPQRTPHPLLRAELDMEKSSLAQKVVGRSINLSLVLQTTQAACCENF